MNYDEPYHEREQFPRYRWTMLAIAWFLHLIDGLVWSSPAPLLLQMVDDLSISFSEAGLVLGTSYLGFIFIPIIGGSISDKLGVTKTAALAASVMASASILRGTSSGLLDLLAYSALVSIGAAVLIPNFPKMIRQWFPAKQRATANGIWNTGFNVGSLVAFAFSIHLANSILGGWRLVFILYGLVYIIAILFWLVLARPPPQTANHARDRATDSVLQKVRHVSQNKDILLLFVIFTVLFGAHAAVLGWLPSLLQDRGFSSEFAGLISSLAWFGSTASSILVPRLSDAIGLRKPFFYILTPLYGLSLYVVASFDGPLLLIAVITLGISASYVFPLAPAIGLELPDIDASSWGTASGLIYTGMGIGGLLISTSGGLMIDATGSFSYSALLFLLISQITIFAVIPLRETGWRKRRGVDRATPND
ncbi:MAG: hypothetical protein CMO12_03750 [Thaumarchaeota archaeon]|nr:hypothetical protein [Nitrososphaerota archaeon]